MIKIITWGTYLKNVLREKYEELGRTPRKRDLRPKDYIRIKKLYGGLEEGLKAANIPVDPYHSVADEKTVIEAIRLCAKENDGQVTPKIYEAWRKKQTKKYPSSHRINNKFGWVNAVRKAGIIPTRKRTKEEILTDLKKRLLELGSVPQISEWNRKGNQLPDFFELKKHDLTMLKAVNECGIRCPNKIPKFNKICPSCYTVFPVDEKGRGYCEACSKKEE